MKRFDYKKIFVGIISLIFILTIMNCENEKKKDETNSAATTPDNNATYEKINIIGEEDAKYGIYDPSVEYDDNGVGWLAYSALKSFGPLDGNNVVDIHLAKSLDYGKTWEFAKNITTTRSGTLTIDGKDIYGTWRAETATLLYDPTDPDNNRRWKLFWVAPFTKPPHYPKKDTIWEHVVVMYKYAATPEKLAEAVEIPLFGSRECPSEICKNLKYILNDNPELKDTGFYMTPGSLVKDGVLYVTLTAAVVENKKGVLKTILVSSHNHGETWKYAGLLMDENEIIDSKYTKFSDSALVEESGKVFLLNSPKKRNLYHGIYVFEFDDISLAKLKRDQNGKLIVYKYISPAFAQTSGHGGGQSEYHTQNSYGGIISSQTVMEEPVERYQIFSTKEKIMD